MYFFSIFPVDKYAFSETHKLIVGAKWSKQIGEIGANESLQDDARELP